MNINQKLLKVQTEVGAIGKDAKNPFFKSKYFDINTLIAHVQPLLADNGLLLLQPIKDGYQYSTIIDVESGEEVNSFLQLPVQNDAQKLGSAITYFRRYTLQSLLGLQAEDDDGNLAGGFKPNNVVRLPSLTLEGFNYLIGKGTPEEIKTALKGRRMTTEQRTQLESKI